MSNTSQGEGWWQASDGKWYAPETRPNYPPPTTEAGPPSEAGPSQPPPGGRPNRWRRFRALPMWKQVVAWAAAAIVLIIVISVAANGGNSNNNKVEAGSPTTPATTAPPSTPAPTTAAPTTSPPSTAPPTTGSPFDSKYGTFAPTSHSGSSAGVVPIPAGAKAGLVTATYTGSSNFVIEGLTAANETEDLLVNEIGAYSGTTAFGFGISGNPPANLKVTASGPWTIKISPISAAPVLASGATGKGDAVYQWTGKATTWAIANQGQGNFVVTNEGSGLLGSDLLVNEIGAFHGSVPVKAGPAVTTIKSDGTWSITFS